MTRSSSSPDFTQDVGGAVCPLTYGQEFCLAQPFKMLRISIASFVSSGGYPASRNAGPPPRQ